MLAYIDMEPLAHTRRTRVNLALGLAIGLALCILNVGVNFPHVFSDFFASQADFPYVRTALNLLFVWLALLLAMAFRRWLEAEHSRAKLENVISGISPDTLCVVDTARVIVMCNPSVRRLFGYTEAELVGKSTDLLYFDQRQRDQDPREVYHDLEHRGFHVGVATGRRSNGSLFPLEVISGELPDGGGLVVLLRDITDRVREEEARREAELRMKEHEHLESLGVLAGGIAHDFNNLLAGILGNAELALTDLNDTVALRGNLDRIIGNCDRAALICRDLLAYAGRGKRRLRYFELAEVVRAEQTHIATLDGGVRVFFDLGEDGDSGVDGDPRQLQQLVRHVVTNAVEAIAGRRQGKVVVAVRGEDYSEGLFEATVGDEPPLPDGRYVVLTVTDNGSGMTEAVRQNVFNPFFSTKFPGRGLGLSSTRGIVRSHGGWLKIATAEGQGTTVTIILSAAKAVPDAVEAVPT